MTEPQDPHQSLPPYPGTPAPYPGAPSPYGGPEQAPYGGPPAYQPGPRPPSDPNTRPGTVTAAACIAIALSALAVLSSLLLISVTSSAVDYVFNHPDEFDVQTSDLPEAGDLRSGLIGISVVLLVLSVVAILVAFATLKRQAWARIALAVLSALTALLAIPFSFGVIGLPWLAGSIAVVVLLFSGRANLWFQGGGVPRP